MQLVPGHIDRNADFGPVQSVTAGLAQHEGAEFVDDAVLFGYRDEIHRAEGPAGGTVPSHERFDRGHSRSIRHHYWLVEDVKFVLFDSAQNFVPHGKRFL
jgi:hypothetical protein